MIEAATQFTPLGLEDARTALYRDANSYSRLPRLIDMQWQMDGEDWLLMLGEMWSGFDNIAQYVDDLQETPFADAFENPESCRHLLMTAEEADTLDRLPHEITISRGCYAHNKWGLSWSLSRKAAERHVTLNRYRQDGQALLVKATIKKANVIALKLDREEQEIVALRPRHLSTRHIR